MRFLPGLAMLTVAAVMTGCASTPSASTQASTRAPLPGMATASTVPRARANLAAASGSLVSGRLLLVPMGSGVHVTGEIGGLPPNSAHGFHIHEHGDCSAADASSAGGHFNPTASVHGRAGSAPHHAGDSDNLVADREGGARVNAHFAGVVLGGAAANDILGKALVVHAAADDYRSQPAGNSGARVACGVIRAGG